MNKMYTKYPVRSPNHDRGFMLAVVTLQQRLEGCKSSVGACAAVYGCQLLVQGYAIVTIRGG